MVALPKLEDLPRQTASDAVLDQLSSQFSERLASLQGPSAARKAAAAFKRKGKLSTRPKAGTAF